MPLFSWSAVSLTQGAHSGPPPTAQAPSVTSLAGTRAERQCPSRIKQGLAARRRLREPETRPLAGRALGLLGKLVGKASLGMPPLCLAPSPSHPHSRELPTPAPLHGMRVFTPFYPHAKPGKQLVLAEPEIVSSRAIYTGSSGQPSPNWAKRCSRHCQDP